MTTDLTPDPEMLARHIALAREMRNYARLISDDPIEQASTLIAAATAIIEVHVGRGLAPAMFSTLVAPSIADWLRDDVGKPH